MKNRSSKIFELLNESDFIFVKSLLPSDSETFIATKRIGEVIHNTKTGVITIKGFDGNILGYSSILEILAVNDE